MTAIIRHRHVWREPWLNPRVNQVVQPGTQVSLVDRYAHGAYGFLTDLGVSWVPAGVDGQQFYYNWIMDGELYEKILRIIGVGSTLASPPTGVPNPVHYEPPLRFHYHMQIICVNNDNVPHVGEVLAAGYTVRRRPD